MSEQKSFSVQNTSRPWGWRHRHTDVWVKPMTNRRKSQWFTRFPSPLDSPAVWVRAVFCRFSSRCAVGFEWPVAEMKRWHERVNYQFRWGGGVHVSVYQLSLLDIHWGAGSRGFHLWCTHGLGWKPEAAPSPLHTPCEASQLRSESFTFTARSHDK